MEYYIRWGTDTVLGRSDYESESEARKLFNKKVLSFEKCQWVELWHEPLDEEDAQYLIEVKEMSQDLIKAQKIANELFG